jgi:engulfment/cell motility protein 1
MQSEFHSSVKDIVSVAVEIANEQHLRKLNQNEPLSEIVQAMCTEFNVSKDSGMYALQLMEQDAGNKYVTEENRGDIRNGSILRLVLSPSEIVKQIIVRLGPKTSDIDGELWALSRLSSLSADPVFAKAFLAKDGYKLIMKMVLDVSESYTNITYCLHSFTWLMRHRLVPPIQDGFVKRLIDFVSSEQHLPVELIECCLVILEKAIRQKEHNVMAGIGIPDLIQHLWNRENPSIQVKALALINALAQGPDSDKILGSMVSKQTRDTIQSNILCSHVSTTMAHELYVYQTLILALLKDSLTTTIDPSGTDAKYITELNNILASTNEDMQNMNGSIVSLNEERDAMTPVDKALLDVMFTKPFVNEDFVCSTPQLVKGSKKATYTRSKSTPAPSSDPSELHKRHSLMIDLWSNHSALICQLTLGCMLYFARHYRRTFMRVVLEEEALSWSFPSTCDRLVRLLCELLGVGKPPKHDGMLYQPMVFTAPNDHPFMEELFCHAVLLMGTTRREMRARTPSDQEKVMLCSVCVQHIPVTTSPNRNLVAIGWWRKLQVCGFVTGIILTFPYVVQLIERYLFP